MKKKPEIKNFKNAEEIRKIPNGIVEMVTVGGKPVGRTIFKPGWKWSESVKPIAGTKSCEFNHLLAIVSGVMKVRMDDGTEIECRPGDVAYIPAGHDAWVIGNEDVVSIDFDGNTDYAKPATNN